MRKFHYILLFLLLSAAFCRKIPYLGKAYPTDPVIHWNGGYYFSASFSKPMLGVGDRLYSASLDFFTPQFFCCGSFGLSLVHLGNSYCNFQRFNGFYISPKFPAGNIALSGWIGPGVVHSGYSYDNFYRFDNSDPLFQSKTNKFAPFIDAGFVAQSDLAMLSVWAKNILQPNLSLNGVDDGKEPLSVEGYIAAKLYRNAVPWIAVEYDGISQKILPAIGVGYRYNGWRFSAGYRRSGIWADISVPIVPQRMWMNYDAGYHLASAEVSRAGITSHRFGVEMVFPEKIRKLPRLPNFVIEPGELPDIWSKDTVHLSVAVINRSDVESDSTTVSFFALSPNETLKVGIVKVPRLKSGEEFLASYVWVPPHLGTFNFIFTVDDDGTRFPGINGRVAETSEEDNQYTHEFLVFGDMKATVSPLIQVLTIPSITFIREEQPIVPLVFFKEKSAEILPKYDTTLSIISQRMIDNPDVVLELRAYVDVETDGDSTSLVKKRAEAVKDRLVKLGTPPSSVIIVSPDEYDYKKPRISTVRENIPPRDKRMVQEENRRVEMVARFEGIPHLVYEFPLEPSAEEIPNKDRAVLDTVADKLAGVLCSDHSAIILIEGIVAKGGNPVEYLRTLDIVRKYLLPRLQVFCPLERIPIAIAGEGKRSKVRIWLSAEAIIFKPIEKESKLNNNIDINYYFI